MDSSGVVPLLVVDQLEAGYGGMQVLWGVDVSVLPGEVVVLLGANGAGKTTLLKTIMGLLPNTGGSVSFDGNRLDTMRPDQRVRMGISFMSELGVFPGLSIEENLRVTGHGLSRKTVTQRLSETWTQFPDLFARRRELAGSLSGGQRKILGVARTQFRKPRLIVMDEPSAGLSPLFVSQLVDRLIAIHAEQRMTLLLAEQNVRFLRLAERIVVIEGGRSRFDGSVEEFEQNENVKDAFFGIERMES